MYDCVFDSRLHTLLLFFIFQARNPFWKEDFFSSRQNVLRSFYRLRPVWVKHYYNYQEQSIPYWLVVSQGEQNNPRI